MISHDYGILGVLMNFMTFLDPVLGFDPLAKVDITLYILHFYFYRVVPLPGCSGEAKPRKASDARKQARQSKTVQSCASSRRVVLNKIFSLKPVREPFQKDCVGICYRLQFRSLRSSFCSRNRRTGECAQHRFDSFSMCHPSKAPKKMPTPLSAPKQPRVLGQHETL